MHAATTPLSGEPHFEKFASSSDYAECRRLHRAYGTTYYFASQRFEPTVRRRTHALYAFVRVPDEWVDNPNGMSYSERAALLGDYRSQMLRGLEGIRPDHAALRAFCDVMREVRMDPDEALLFLDAMEDDLTVTRYQTYSELQHYMRGSASAVGVMMCDILGVPRTPATIQSASALGEAMQLTNFLRDIGEDTVRGRIYIPQEDLASFGVPEADILSGRITEPFINLMKFEIARSRALYEVSDSGMHLLPNQAQLPVRLARVLYSRILDRIEQQNFDVFRSRARTSTTEKLLVAAKLVLGRAS